MLQSTDFSYHFSARLRPWVHYVPLTYTTADLIEKVEWLRAHDGMARQLADNARHFGVSHLRMEDYFCYAGAAFSLLGDLEKGSEVLQPFPAGAGKATITSSIWSKWLPFIK